MISPYWNKEITIFTKYYDEVSKKTKWYKYKSENCFYGLNRATLFKDMEIYNANKNIVRIPAREDYVKYEEWCKLSHEDKKTKLSLSVGSIIFLGYIDDEILENESGNDLMKKYKNKCFKVNVYTINDVYKLKHYYLSGA